MAFEFKKVVIREGYPKNGNADKRRLYFGYLIVKNGKVVDGPIEGLTRAKKIAAQYHGYFDMKTTMRRNSSLPKPQRANLTKISATARAGIDAAAKKVERAVQTVADGCEVSAGIALDSDSAGQAFIIDVFLKPVNLYSAFPLNKDVQRAVESVLGNVDAGTSSIQTRSARYSYTYYVRAPSRAIPVE